jgi:hypothetical protein
VPTAERAAKNESLFREVNERILELQEEFERKVGGAFPDAAFICECSFLDCTERIELSLEEYAAVRTEPTHFAVTPGHVDPDHERVVRATDRYVVVEKLGAAGDVAEEEAADDESDDDEAAA